ncbi:universal stress protein [Natronolimnobius baerhuensis]|uniref:Universal stress protein UspA n=1 Tax=Natronolimnobius baerhuensis TaxID=253108 RepID=A0A202E800_9EURY|nr:universal stress protein [Natronolimnobius baerhuensis]OVE84080.1 universal stress protein UspA [Natronolimnobius baerhuensis]
MYEILLAIDDSKSRARSQVEAIVDIPVDSSSVRIHVVHVFTDNPSGATIQKLGSAKTVKRALSDHGIDYQLEERSGDPATEIRDYAVTHDVDLICLAGRKRSPAGKALFGSVTQDVILNTERPVLVANEGDAPDE